MRLLFCALPAYGHVYPLLPLADAVARAGHEVEFATTGPFVAIVAGLGYETHDVGPTIEAARAELIGSTHTSAMPRDENGRPDRSAAGRLFIDLLGRPTAADLGPLLHRRRPDLVVYESYDLGAAIAAAVAGIPAIDLGVSPRLSDVEHRAFAGDRLERVWAEHESVAPSFDVFTGDAYLDPFPDALQPAAFHGDPSRVRMRSVPFSDPTTTLPAWVASTDRPLVYLTLGTIVATGDVLRPAVDGLATSTPTCSSRWVPRSRRRARPGAAERPRRAVRRPGGGPGARRSRSCTTPGPGRSSVRSATARRSCCSRRGPTSSPTPTAWSPPGWRRCSSRGSPPPRRSPPRRRMPWPILARPLPPPAKSSPRCPARRRSWTS